MKHRFMLLSKKTTCMVLALVLTLSCFLTNAGALVQAAAKKYEADTVLKENDYSTAAAGLTPWYYGNTSGDFYAVKDPKDNTNTVMQYKHDWYGCGAIYLGAEYKSNDNTVIPGEMKNETVQVEGNVAYEVEYDYYVTGTPDTKMEISLVAGNNTAVETWDTPKYTISYSERMMDLAAEVDASTGEWVRNQKAKIVIPDNADLKNGGYLMIYATACKTATIYFDNIKVTALAGVDVEYHIDGKTETIYYADGIVKEYAKTNSTGKKAVWYSDSSRQTLFKAADYVRKTTYETLKLYGAWPSITYDKDTVLKEENTYTGAYTQHDGEVVFPGLFVGSSGDMIPTNDPKDSANQVMMYKHDWYNKGALFLGASYQNYTAETIKSEAVQVEAGVTYEIEYDFYTAGKVDHPEGLNLYLAVGNNPGNDSSGAYQLEYGYKSVIAHYNDEQTLNMADWQRDNKARITIPQDADLSKGTYLMIVAEYGGRNQAFLYFDNVKVTALAGVSVIYVTDSETKTVYYSDGVITDYTATNATGEEAKWYKDSEFTEPFDVNAWTRPGVYKEIVLYGKWQSFSYGEDSVLFESGYDSASVLKLDAPRSEQFYQSSGDVSPVKDPTGGNKGNVLWYRQNWYGVGQVMLGWEYNHPADVTPIAVHKDITYEISFDYNVTGKTVYSGLEIGVALSNESLDWSKVSQGNYKTTIGESKTLISYPMQTETNSGWQRYTAYFTVNEEVTDNSKLVLYAIGGNQEGKGGVYFDNVKVTGLKNRTYTVKFETNGGNAMATQTYDLAGLNSLPSPLRSNSEFLGWYSDAALTVPFSVQDYLKSDDVITVYAKWRYYTTGSSVSEDTVLFESGYDDALAQKTKNPRTELFWKTSGDLSPVKDPTKSGKGNVLWYRQDWYGLGTAVLGWEFDDPDKVKTITVKHGMTYSISYDYNVVGSTGCSPMEIGIAVGKAHTDYEKISGNNFYENVSQYKVVNQYEANTAINSGWVRRTVYFTVNSDTDLSQNNKLLLYVKNGNQEGTDGVYFDNVKVTALKNRTYTVKFVTNGGKEMGTQQFDLAGLNNLPQAVRSDAVFTGWYTDADLKVPFDLDNYIEHTSVITLYASWYMHNAVINFDDARYYEYADGKRGFERLSEVFTVENQDGNNYLRYYLKHSETEKVEESGKCVGNYGTYGGVIGLFDPANLQVDNWTYSDVAETVQTGDKYFISFKYKSVSVDTEGNYPSMISFGVGVTNENSVHGGRQFFKRDICPMDEQNGEWKTGSVYFAVPELAEDGNRLSLIVFGYGEIYIDDIKVTPITNGVIFDTDGGTVIEPIIGSAGTAIQLPEAPVRADSKFEGWYLDEKGTQPYTESKIEQGVKVLYAKFLTYQSIQDFEHYSIGKSERFETDYYLNKKTEDSDQTEYYSWLGSKFNAEHVRNGSASVFRKGELEHSRMVGLFYVNNPLTVGEKYELSVWVKVTEYFLAGDIQLVHSDYLDNVRMEEYWNESQRGARYETLVSTESMSEHQGEWLEIKYTFTAKAKYIGLNTPGITGMYIDDACITLESADSSYTRSIDGPGLKFEDWYSETSSKDKDAFDEDYIKLDLNSNMNAAWVVIAIVSGVAVLALVGITTVVVIRKKRRVKKA